MTKKLGHKPIQMKRVDTFTAAGDFCWVIEDGKRTLRLAIPHAKGFIHSDWTIDHKNDCNAQWSWDGNEKEPTLVPSLHAVGIWHGYVRKGMLVEA